MAYPDAAIDCTTQYCMIVARAWAFPLGQTLVSVRVLDTEGNPGPIKQMRIVRPGPVNKPKAPAPKKK